VDVRAGRGRQEEAGQGQRDGVSFHLVSRFVRRCAGRSLTAGPCDVAVVPLHDSAQSGAGL
ncbi:MAG TPA: hypothetical protein VK001_06435, partial [Geminicoccaceae bacterium]|nr:hypothetical protein [Geminicoccaceae bacterium]